MYSVYSDNRARKFDNSSIHCDRAQGDYKSDMGVKHLGISWLFSLAQIGNSDANPSITSDFLK